MALESAFKQVSSNSAAYRTTCGTNTDVLLPACMNAASGWNETRIHRHAPVYPHAYLTDDKLQMLLTFASHEHVHTSGYRTCDCHPPL